MLMCKHCDFIKIIFPLSYGLILNLVITNILKYTLKVERPSTPIKEEEIDIHFHQVIRQL